MDSLHPSARLDGALVRMCPWYLSWGSDSFPPTALWGGLGYRDRSLLSGSEDGG